MMKQECTELLLKYRDIARMIWNTAYWPNTKLRDGDCFTTGAYLDTFREALARLFEGIVLLPLGYVDRVQDLNHPGATVALSIEVTSPNVECFLDENLPADPHHIWNPIGVSINPGEYDFVFRELFDWDQLAYRDFSFVRVLIQRMDLKPDAAGHHAIIPTSECSVWVAPPVGSG